VHVKRRYEICNIFAKMILKFVVNYNLYELQMISGVLIFIWLSLK